MFLKLQYISAISELYFRDLDSVGAVGAAAPTDFEEGSFFPLTIL